MAIWNPKTGKWEEDEKIWNPKSGKYELNGNSSKAKLYNKIGFDTLGSDLNTLGTTVNNIYGGWHDAETMTKTKLSIAQMGKRLEALKQYNERYGDGSIDVTQTYDAYAAAFKDLDELQKQYGKYKSSEDYQKAYEKAKVDAEAIYQANNKSLDDYDTEIASLQKIVDKLDDLKPPVRTSGTSNPDPRKKNGKKSGSKTDRNTVEKNGLYSNKAYNEYLKTTGYASLHDAREALANLKEQRYKANQHQTFSKLLSVADPNSENYDANFAKKVEKGKAISHKDLDSNFKEIAVALYEHNGGSRWDAYIGKEVAMSGAGTLLDKYSYFTEEEFDLIAYYLAEEYDKLKKKKSDYYTISYKKEETKLEKYLKSMEETLNQRQAVAEFEKGLEGNTFLELLYSVPAGLDQFGSGLVNLFNFKDDYIPPTVTQMKSGMVREDLADVGFKIGDTSIAQIGYDFGTTTANMLPSILTSVAANAVVPGSGGYIGAGLMGASASGNAYQQAINSGWDKGQARTYSVLVGVSEAALSSTVSKVFGGKLPAKVQTAINGIDNGLLRFAANYGTAFSSEGFEEAAQEVLTPLFENIALGYNKNDISDTDWSEVAYSGLLGGLSGGAFEIGGMALGTKLTSDEQKVFDLELKNRIAESEAEGLKLTEADKKALEKAVKSDLKNGYISTDVIEEALGGDSYTAYKGAVDNETALLKEYEELGNKTNATLAEQTRYSELKSKVDELKNNSQKENLKSKLSDEVFALVKNSRLAESYNEKYRRGEAFKVDYDIYDKKYHVTLKKAEESGILNNTKRTHEFVDMIAKISADKGVLFDFTDNKRLKDSSLALKNKIIDGYVDENGNVVINASSPKSINVVVGHEITHILEGTELYESFSELITQYAKSKGEYESRLAELKELYKDVAGANVENELVADLVGDYLFTDKDFIKRLSVQNPNLFKKIFNEIKYLCKVATAGSKQARELEKVKKTFEEVYRETTETQKTTADNSGEFKYSLSDIDIPTREQLENKGSVKIVDISTPKSKGSFAERRAQIKNDIQDIISKPYLNKDTQTMIFLTNKSYEHAFSNSGYIQLNAAEHLPELIENAILTHSEDVTHGSDYATGIYTFFAAVKADQIRPVKLKVKEFSYKGQELPKNIKAYFDRNPQDYAASYDTVVLEVEKIEESPIGSVKNIDKNNLFLDPSELSEISISDLLNLVNGSAKKYIPVKNSISKLGEYTVNYGTYHVKSQDIRLETEADDIAPVSKQNVVKPNISTENIAPLYNTPITEEEANAQARENLDSLYGYDAPPETSDDSYYESDTVPIDESTLKNIVKLLQKTLFLNPQETKLIREIVQQYSTSDISNKIELFKKIKEQFGEKSWREQNKAVSEIKRYLKDNRISVSKTTMGDIADFSQFKKRYSNKIRFSKNGIPVDVAYMSLTDAFPSVFPEDITNPTDQLLRMSEVADLDVYSTQTEILDDEIIQRAIDIIVDEVGKYKSDIIKHSVEDMAKENLDSIAPAKATQIAEGMTEEAKAVQSLENYPIKTVDERIAEKVRALEAELAENKQLMRESTEDFDKEISRLSEVFLGKKDKSTKVANNIIRRIAKFQRMKSSIEADYAKRINDIEEKIEKMNTEQYRRAIRKQVKMQEHAQWAESLIGDTSTWVDKKLGLQYSINTEHRNLRDIVRDENGKEDIERADRINDELNGRYNREQANVNRELAKTRKKYADLKITNAESVYIQMLGELRHNPETTLTEYDTTEYYNKHKKAIDKDKVNKVIEMARKDFDDLRERLNAELRNQGMREIPYRKGYFPHFNNPKQGFISKLLNWKKQNNEIPTSIAGLTEGFKPVRSYQSFDKQRKGDTTDYDFLQGFDNYLEGAIDWIYHIDTLQKRRAVENYIRYIHSEEGIQERINEVYANEEFDADEAQAQIEHILAEGKNPLNNFIQDFMTHTNILAGKKNSFDRGVESKTNRQIYSAMTNIQNRLGANMVLGNVRSALTNFIPITQSWAQVSPFRSLQAAKDTIANAIKDDGLINKSTFLTNRLKEADKLYKTKWDKVLDKAGIMFEVVDNISSQVIWRSKYNQNIASGMTESEAIKNADQFAENVMAGRSKGNEPTLFNAKNPFAKAFTVFQLEVNNQYGYFLKDVPNDLKEETNHWKLNLAKGFATAFIGAYVYNALLEQIAGSGAALDPISIIEELLRDLGLFDDEEEKEADEVVTNLVGNVVEELPFIGGWFGGGRIPINSVLPYNDKDFLGGVEAFTEDVSKGNLGNIGKELMNPILNIGLPVGGNQIKKTYQGLNMFNTDEDHPIAGSYTDSGNLRFPVDDTIGNRIQAGLFGQYASDNARKYFDGGYAPLKEKQIEEFVDVDLPIADYWKYREGLSGLKTLAEKADYIAGLDIPVEKKNILINNISGRKDPIDLTDYDNYGSFEEFDYASKNPEKYMIAKAVGGYNSYKKHSKLLNELKTDYDKNGKAVSGSRKTKVVNYINSINADYGEKIILFKSEYPADDTYNYEIIDYLNSRSDISYSEMVTILKELGFDVLADGTVKW